MFYHKKTGFCTRQIVYIVLAALVLTLAVFGISYSALAIQDDDDAPLKMTTVQVDGEGTQQIQVIEEIDLGEFGIFPADHILYTIHADGNVYTVDSFGKTGDELLALYGFTLQNQDYTEQVENEYGYDLYINRLTVETYTEEVVVEFETERVADDTMMEGKEVVSVEGKNGLHIETYEKRVLNGETTVEKVGTEVVEEVVNKVVVYGTKKDFSEPTGFKNNGGILDLTNETVVAVDKVNQTFTLSNGEVISYSRALSCKAYAYCEVGGITAMGTAPRQGEIAVDPKVIPLGSKVFVITENGSVVYGFATAEDTGGDIKGNTVDLHYNSEALCRQFGVRRVTVFVLD